jgi:hypothetical protein
MGDGTTRPDPEIGRDAAADPYPGGVPGASSRVPGDPDGDWLTDRRERRMGTDPANADTDRDRLSDGWGVANETGAGAPLLGADPLGKDVYVVVARATGVAPLDAGERRDLERVRARMPVASPGGDSGVDVHAVARRDLDERVVYGCFTDGERPSVGRIYDDRLPESEQCAYHLAVFAGVDADRAAGLGSAPGFGVLVDGERERSYGDASVPSASSRTNSPTASWRGSTVRTARATRTTRAAGDPRRRFRATSNSSPSPSRTG